MIDAPVLSPTRVARTSLLRSRWALPAVAGAVVLLAGAVWFINQHWPYRYREVKPLLENVLASKVTVSQYHRTYFPHPGFVSVGLTMRRSTVPSFPPIGTAQILTVQGSWLDLLMFRQRVQRVSIDGLHVTIPEANSPASKQEFPPGSSVDFSGPETLINRMDLRNSQLEVVRASGGVYSFPIRSLEMQHIQRGQIVRYNLDMLSPAPSGHIQAQGTFGPLNAKDLAATPLTGQFTFDQVNLAKLGKIRGTLSSSGSFHGRLGAIEAEAAVETPDFAVTSGTATPVQGKVNATVNGLNGDTLLHNIEASIGMTTIHAQGAVAGSPKITNLDIAVTRGRVQDILRPFVKNRVPITGSVWMKSHAYLASSREGKTFMQRLQVDGAFAAPDEHIADHHTERSLSDFSQRAQGGKPADPGEEADVISSIGGAARIRNGIVSTQHLNFTIPGAQATMNGSFNFHDESVHLLGTLKMDADISHAATGFKSFLLKPLVPFFKKKKAGAVVSVAVTGTPGNYAVNQNILHDK